MDFGFVAQSVKLMQEKDSVDLKDVSLRMCLSAIPRKSGRAGFKQSWGLTFLAQILNTDLHLNFFH